MKQKHKTCLTALATFTLLEAMTALAQSIAYPVPVGGWDYAYLGSGATYGSGWIGGYTAGGTPVFDSLDATWNRGQDSDAWDGSGLGGTYGIGNLPGGVEVGIEVGTTYLRIQDPGDPRNATLGWTDPSNRKIYFGHDLSAQGFGNTFLNSGVTLTFRARVPTTGVLDTLWTRNNTTPVAYPAGGDGYVTFGQGKGMFTLGNDSNGGGAIGFSLATASDYAGGSGLLMNELNGTTINNNVDTGEGGVGNLFPIEDANIWHEFWIIIQSGGAGTHQVSVYMDGSLTPSVFDVTAGNETDYGSVGVSLAWLGMGLGLTGAPGAGSGAVDVDFVAVKQGVIIPVPEPATMSLVVMGLLALAVRYRSRIRG
jgi:hypothetical protein